MGHTIDTRGKYFNQSADGEVNQGVRGKFSIEQLEERKELHARRLHDGFPRIIDITEHFSKKYGIDVHYQSEKDWCARDKNKAAILATQEKMLDAGQLKIATLSNQTLFNSLAESARSEASFLKTIKTKCHSMMKTFDGDMSPWGILGMTKVKYYAATDEERIEWTERVEVEKKLKFDIVNVCEKFSKMMKAHSEEVRKVVELSINANNSQEIVKHNQKRAFNKAVSTELIKKADEEQVLSGAEVVGYTDGEIDELRKVAGIE